MTALILLEYHFIKGKDGNVDCDRVVDYKYLKRYLKVFDKIILCARMTNTSSDCSDKLLVSGDNVEFVGLPDFQGIKGIVQNYLIINKTIKDIISKVDCCIMRAPNHLSLLLYRKFKKNNLPFALEFNIAADKFIENNSFLGKLINNFVVMEAKKMCMTANGVSYVTEHVLQDVYPCRALKFGASDDYFTASYSSIDLTDEMIYEQGWNVNQPPAKINIVHTGYMDSYRKGHVVLINAIKKVIDSGYKNVKLILVGDGNKRDEFQNLVNELGITEYVEFKGLIKKKTDMTEILKKCHMLVFPTKSEGLPRSIIEAMAVGLVCISSPVDGIPELLEADMMINYDDFNGYADKIIELINDWNKMIRISNKNTSIAKKYHKDVVDLKRKSFYQSLKKLCLMKKK